MALPADYIRRSGDGRATALAQRQSPGPVRQASPEQPGAAVSVATMFTRAYDAWGVGSAWLKQLAVNDDSILRREGQHDLALFNALLDDDVAFQAFQQRQLAVIARPTVVEPGDDSPAAKVAADHLQAQIDAVGWDRICSLMLYGRWFGYAVGELIYKLGPDGKFWMADIVVPDRAWFGFTNEGELRMRSPNDPEGVPVPPNKFWAYRAGGTHDFVAYGTGLAHWCYWPVWFKKNAIKFWALFLEKFGMPTTVGLLPPGTQDDDPLVAQVLDVAQAVGRDSAVVVNALTNANSGAMESPLSTIEASRSGSGASSYKDFIDTLDDAITRVILGQTMTSRAAAQGIGSNQSDTQKDVRDEIVRADADLLHESFNRGPAVWLTRWNFGDNVAPPRVYRNMSDDEDLNVTAERDATLDGIGIRRTDESITQTYGDGYERKPEPPPPPAIVPGGNVVSLDAARRAKVAEFAAQGTEKPFGPLYVSRKLLNGGDLLAWARRQGFTDLEPEADLHVTVLYSKGAVDWFDMAGEGWDDGKLTVGPGGVRFVERFGDGPDAAIVLRFASAQLRWRHDSMIERGATSDFPDYAPHVTFTYAGGDVDLAKVEPYTGELRFGPEIFEPIKSDGDSVTFTAEDEAAIDGLVAELTAEADPIFHAMADHLADAVKRHGVTDPAQLRVALLEAVESLPTDRLARLSAMPMLATRAAATAGVEDRLVTT